MQCLKYFEKARRGLPLTTYAVPLSPPLVYYTPLPLAGAWVPPYFKPCVHEAYNVYVYDESPRFCKEALSKQTPVSGSLRGHRTKYQ